jgi:hypothetical protein
LFQYWKVRPTALVSDRAVWGFSYRTLALRPLLRQRRILSETELLAIYLLLFAWNILNVRFV